jgi:hypothetical protein
MIVCKIECKECNRPANKYSETIYLCDTHAAIYGYCYLCSKKKSLLSNNGMCYNCYRILSSKDDLV